MEMGKKCMFDTIRTSRKAGEALEFLMQVGPILDERAQAPYQENQGRLRNKKTI